MLNTLVKLLFSPIFLLKNWPVVYKDLFKLIRKDKESFNLRNGIKLFFTPNLREFFVIDEIWRRNIYSPNARFKIHSKDTIVDIGAHKGYFTVYAAKKAYKGTVHAFEPFAQNFAFLKKNCETNKCKNVVLENIAVSNTSKKQTFYSSEQITVGGSLLHTKYTNTKIFKKDVISCTTLKNIINETTHKRINLLKSDCEGAEYLILLNLDRKSLNKIDKMSIEYHNIGGHRVDEIDNFLRENGFKTEIKPEGSVIGMLYAYRS